MPKARVINSLSSGYWKQYQSILLLVVDEKGERMGEDEGTRENEMTAFDRRNIRLAFPSDVQFWQFCRLKQTSSKEKKLEGCQSNFSLLFRNCDSCSPEISKILIEFVKWKRTDVKKGIDKWNKGSYNSKSTKGNAYFRVQWK